MPLWYLLLIICEAYPCLTHYLYAKRYATALASL